MSENPLVATRDLGSPLSRDLAEMVLTLIDLKNSLASLTHWSNSFTSDQDYPDKNAIEGSLFRDGITQLVACFDSNNAVPLVVEEVFPGAEGIDDYFRWLRGLRVSYTAHRHGSARQCVVGAAIDPQGNFLGISELFAIYSGPNRQGHADLLRVVSQSIRYTESKIAAMRSELEREAKMLSPEQLLKLPTARVQPPGPAEMRKSRGDVKKGFSRKPGELSE